MPSPYSRLSAHEEERARSYEVLQHARDAAHSAYKYDSRATRDKMVKEFKGRMGGLDPYPWQLDVAEAVLLGLDCTVIAGTGCGKTMPFIMPAFVEVKKIYIIVSPLNALESDQAERFRKYEVPTVVLNGTTITAALLKDIEDFKYRVVLTSPEMLQTPAVSKVMSNPAFAKRVGAFIIDEAHCIKQWAKDTEFRREYGRLAKLRALVPQGAPVLATSATLTRHALNEVREELCIHAMKSFHLNLGNDRVNIKQEMRFIKSGSDYGALDFIVQAAKEAKDIPRTLVFVDDIQKCHAAAHRLREVAAGQLRECIGLFHAQRTLPAKDDVLHLFRDGYLRVLVATEAAGMGMDIPDIELVVQFGVPETLSIWLQRAGRAGRSPTVHARAIMLVQSSVVQEVHLKKGGDTAEDSDSDFHEEEEHIEEQQGELKKDKRVFRKNVEDALREWIEAKACRRAVADAYFDNPPRAHGSFCPPSLCCDLCAARAPSSVDQPPASSTVPEAAHNNRPGLPTHSQDIKAEDDDDGVLDIDEDRPKTPEGTQGTANILTRPRKSPKRRKDKHLKHVKMELRAWRLRTRRSKYAGTSLKAENILPDRALQTIASVREGIKTVDDLRATLKPPWPLLDIHGAEVLDLVKNLDREDAEHRRLRNLQTREARKRLKDEQSPLGPQAAARARHASVAEGDMKLQGSLTAPASHTRPMFTSTSLNTPSTALASTGQSSNLSVPSHLPQTPAPASSAPWSLAQYTAQPTFSPHPYTTVSAAPTRHSPHHVPYAQPVARAPVSTVSHSQHDRFTCPPHPSQPALCIPHAAPMQVQALHAHAATSYASTHHPLYAPIPSNSSPRQYTYPAQTEPSDPSRFAALHTHPPRQTYPGTASAYSHQYPPTA